MGKKIKLGLCANYQLNELNYAITSSLLCDYIIEQLGDVIKRLNKEDLDLFYVYEDYKKAIVKGNEITFASLNDWTNNRVETYQDCLNIVVDLDNIASQANKIQAGEVIEQVRKDSNKYAIYLSVIDVSLDEIDLKDVEIKAEHIDNLLKQLRLVDEGQFLSDLGLMKFEMLPLDVMNVRNKFVEQKLKRINSIAKSVGNTLEREFDRLHQDVISSYKKFRNIAYASLSDGEKYDEAMKACRVVESHREVLDKLENKLTTANEIKRQLTIHKDKLKQNEEDRIDEFNAILEEKPYEVDSVTRERGALEFVTDEYIENINSSIAKINQIEEDITIRYKMIDKIENALNSAIATESELKRYSSISFKFEDLYVRLELAKSQIKKQDKDFASALNTAILGLGVLINLGLEGKDVFMRNNLLSAVFGCVNGIYDIVENDNRSVELSQISFVTARLVQYSKSNNIFTKDLQTFRRVCNNAIRDIAMMMGKPFNLQTMLQIVDAIELTINQVQELLNTLNANHEEQTRQLGDIFNIQ